MLAPEYPAGASSVIGNTPFLSVHGNNKFHCTNLYYIFMSPFPKTSHLLFFPKTLKRDALCLQSLNREPSMSVSPLFVSTYLLAVTGVFCFLNSLRPPSHRICKVSLTFCVSFALELEWRCFFLLRKTRKELLTEKVWEGEVDFIL